MADWAVLEMDVGRTEDRTACVEGGLGSELGVRVSLDLGDNQVEARGHWRENAADVVERAEKDLDADRDGGTAGSCWSGHNGPSVVVEGCIESVAAHLDL